MAESSSAAMAALRIEDDNHPFFLYHSDGAHTVVVNPLLDNTNYLTWSRSFALDTSIKNKMGFLDGSIQMPSLDSPLYIPWVRCNNLILSWLLKSISEEIASNVFHINLAKEVWDKLRVRFAQPDNIRIFQLKQQLGSVMQGARSVSEYFTQLNGIWEELRNYKPSAYCVCGKCTCAGVQSLEKDAQMDNTFKFLMGLNDSYDVVRGQINTEYLLNI